MSLYFGEIASVCVCVCVGGGGGGGGGEASDINLTSQWERLSDTRPFLEGCKSGQLVHLR